MTRVPIASGRSEAPTTAIDRGLSKRSKVGVFMMPRSRLRLAPSETMRCVRFSLEAQQEAAPGAACRGRAAHSNVRQPRDASRRPGWRGTTPITSAITDPAIQIWNVSHKPCGISGPRCSRKARVGGHSTALAMPLARRRSAQTTTCFRSAQKSRFNKTAQTGNSSAGSAWHIEPTIVPRLRVPRWPTSSMAWMSNGARRRELLSACSTLLANVVLGQANRTDARGFGSRTW